MPPTWTDERLRFFVLRRCLRGGVRPAASLSNPRPFRRPSSTSASVALLLALRPTIAPIVFVRRIVVQIVHIVNVSRLGLVLKLDHAPSQRTYIFPPFPRVMIVDSGIIESFNEIWWEPGGLVMALMASLRAGFEFKKYFISIESDDTPGCLRQGLDGYVQT